MNGMDGSPVPVSEHGDLSRPFPARSILLGASAGRQGKDLKVCSVQPRAVWGDVVGVLQSTRGTPGCFSMGRCVDRAGEMVASLSRPTPPPSLRNSHGHGDTQYPLLYQTWRRPPISPTSAQSVWGYKDVLLLLITIDCQLEPHLCNLCPSAISGYLQATSFTCRGPRWAMTGEIRA